MAKRKSRGINGEGGISWDAKRKRHVARISIPNLDGTLRRPSASFKTKAEAEAWRRQAISERESGSTLAFEADELTVKEYIERWLEDSAKPSIAPNTYLKYEQEVRLRIIPHLGAVRLKALTPAHVEFFKLELLKTLKPSTVIQALQCLAAALNQAASWNLINESPTKKVKRPKIPKEEMICLTEEEAARLVEVAKGTRDEAVYLVALKCGLRIGEIAALRWEDLDTKKKLLTVSRSVFVRHGKPQWGSTKTGEERGIALGERLLDALERHRKMQVEECLACPYPWGDERAIFPDESGKIKTHALILNALRRHLKAAKLPKIRFHDLRDTAATLMLSNGVEVPTVARILGHKDPAITLRKYAHVLPSMQERAARVSDSYSF